MDYSVSLSLLRKNREKWQGTILKKIIGIWRRPSRSIGTICSGRERIEIKYWPGLSMALEFKCKTSKSTMKNLGTRKRCNDYRHCMCGIEYMDLLDHMSMKRRGWGDHSGALAGLVPLILPPFYSLLSSSSFSMTSFGSTFKSLRKCSLTFAFSYP